MKICVFDTETTSLEKPFAYNIGYNIYDTETDEKIIRRDFVVEQIWHNLPLFVSAYYADKRTLYVERMKAKKVIMNKFGYICQQMIRDFALCDVSSAYAYNSNFDEKVFNFCCDWFKCKNPFDNVPIFDIWGYSSTFIASKKDYILFCEENQLFTDTGNYSATAETMFRYLTKDLEFTEEHTAAADSDIELEVLKKCIELGAEWETAYKVKKVLPRMELKTLTVVDSEGESHYFDYTSKRVYKKTDTIKLKNEMVEEEG